MQEMIAALTKQQRYAWETHFAVLGGERDRRVEEGLWRRTQMPENASTSGWRSSQDARRRILHYRYQFNVAKKEGAHGSLVMEDAYIFYSLALPAPEIRTHLSLIRNALTAGGWIIDPDLNADDDVFNSVRGDLICEVVRRQIHPEDKKLDRILPRGYEALDVTIRSAPVEEERRALPWNVLAGGMRVPDRRGNPALLRDVEQLLTLGPFQVEVGCGMSVESGIPALHYLHDLYRVTDRSDRSFVFAPEADDFLRGFLLDTTAKLREHSTMYLACLAAEPADAHQALDELREAGLIVGDVVTNNFDGLLARVGFTERYVRRYDEQVPVVDFHPEAKSLLVIGSHADRRRVQHRARQRGMTVVYMDSEGFWDSGVFTEYPLEGPQDEDVIWRTTANQGLRAMVEHATRMRVEAVNS